MRVSYVYQPKQGWGNLYGDTGKVLGNISKDIQTVISKSKYDK